MSTTILTQTRARLRRQIAELEQLAGEIALLQAQAPFLPAELRTQIRTHLESLGIRDGSLIEVRMQVEGVIAAKREMLHTEVYQT